MNQPKIIFLKTRINHFDIHIRKDCNQSYNEIIALLPKYFGYQPTASLNSNIGPNYFLH